MESEFVTPDVTRLTLDGVNRWIEVKRELNAGEQRKLFTALVKDLHVGEAATLDANKVGITKVLAYLVGWSFTDQAGKVIPISSSAVDNLKVGTYAEIVKAIDDHEEKADEELAARKNAQGIGSTSSLISQSPSDAIGVTNG